MSKIKKEKSKQKYKIWKDNIKNQVRRSKKRSRGARGHYNN